MVNTDLRTIQMVHAVPRKAFISSSDMHELISGHSIPSQAAVRSILTRVLDFPAFTRHFLVWKNSRSQTPLATRPLYGNAA